MKNIFGLAEHLRENWEDYLWHEAMEDEDFSNLTPAEQAQAMLTEPVNLNYLKWKRAAKAMRSFGFAEEWELENLMGDVYEGEGWEAFPDLADVLDLVVSLERVKGLDEWL